LVLVGGAGWLSDSLHNEVKRLSAQGWLRYLGFVHEVDLPKLYAGARVFVYPSSYEGFGLPVLEAMASGIPVVAANRSTLPEVCQGAALLADPDDLLALAECVAKGLEDEPWRASARALGLAVACRHPWAACVEKTVSVYRKALA
jgi:alpha-1,3-rhamnosyl/mannosyltransferase